MTIPMKKADLVKSNADPGAERRPDKHQCLDNKLDEALRQTFPASDPFSLTDDDDPNERATYASPPCFMHELDYPEFGMLHDDDGAACQEPAPHTAKKPTIGPEGFHPYQDYLGATELLDFHDAKIQQVVHERMWPDLAEEVRLNRIYNYVKEEVLFDFSAFETLPASKILQQRRGGTIDKTVVLMALLRACNIPCMFRAYQSDKGVLHEAISSGVFYWLTPSNLMLSSIEVFVDGCWFELRHYVMGRAHAKAQKSMSRHGQDTWFAYGIVADNIADLPQSLTQDRAASKRPCSIEYLGMFDTPDEFCRLYHPTCGRIRSLVLRYLFTPAITSNIGNIANVSPKRACEPFTSRADDTVNTKAQFGVHKILARVRRWRQRRAILRELTSLKGSLLHDIGIDPDRLEETLDAILDRHR